MGNEDRFTDINPDDLPPELQVVYKSLQRDYTKKRQADSNRAREAEERLTQLEAQTAKQAEYIEQAQAYIVSLENTNTDWQKFFETNKDKLETKMSDDKLSEKEKEILNTDKKLLTKAELADLDEYFEGKFGKGFSELSSQVKKLTTQVKFGQQLNEIDRTYGGQLKSIDRDKIINRAIERGDGDAFKAFDDVYGADLKEAEFTDRLAKEKEKWIEESKNKAMAGITSAHKPHIYVRPDNAPRTYEEASEQTINELAASGGI